MPCRYAAFSRLAISLLAAGLHACSTGPVRQIEPSPPGTETIAILGTNDLHGAISQAPLLAGYARALRQEWGSSLLWLDAGDSLTGTLEAEADGGASMVAFLNSVGLDATAVGDRDLTAANLPARISEAHFPFLSANLEGLPGVSASRILRAGSLRVGVVGLSGLELSGSRASVPRKKRPFESGPLGQPLGEAVIRESKRVRSDGAQIVVALAHVGQRCETGGVSAAHSVRKPQDFLGSCAKGDELARLLEHLPPGTLDAVVSGDSHTVVHHWIGGVPVVQGGHSGSLINVIYLVYDWNHRQLLAERTRIEGPIPVAKRSFHGTSIEADAQVEEIARAVLRKVEPEREIEVAKAARPLEYSRVLECDMGNLVADAVRAATSADVALVNPGSIRSGLASGMIRYAELYRALPYDARVVTVELTGEELSLLLRIATNGARGLMKVSGLQLKVLQRGTDAKATDLDGDKRISPWEVNRFLDARLVPTGEDEDLEPIQARKKYKLATLDFLARGGDDLAWFFGKLPDDRFSRDRGPILREAVRSFLRASHQPVNSATQPLVSASDPRYRFEKAKAKVKHRKRRKK